MTLHGGHWDLPISDSPDKKKKKKNPLAIRACPDAYVQKHFLPWWAQDISKSCEHMPSAKGQESLMVCSVESGKGTRFLYLSGQTCDSQSWKSSFCCGQGIGWDHAKGNSQDKDGERLGAKDLLEHPSLITNGTRPSLKFMSRDIMSFLLKQCGVCYFWPCTHWMKYSQGSHHLSMTEESSCMHNWPQNYFKQTVWETYTITRSRITE